MKRENQQHGKTVVAAMPFLAIVLLGSTAVANCLIPENGKIVDLTVTECKVIIAEEDKMVQQYAGELFETWNLDKAYTGALITDKIGITWMYPSSEANPCQQFPINKVVKKRAYFTCCDTGRWGKCVFGGNWLGDIEGEPINAFQ